jgi:alpha-beta hydrolase superfamily lysophospholipase
MLTIKSFDGYNIKGKLYLPDTDDKISKLVIHINGAGPNTYNVDFFPDYYASNGIAFFSYNTRGVDVSTSEKVINDDEYITYKPSTSVEDIFHIIKTLKGIECLKNCFVFLNGWSEGAIIAPLFVKKYQNMVDAIFLFGYSNVNLKDTQKWQCSKIDGGDAMLEECFNAIERKDNKWLMNNMGVTAEWFSEHYNLTSNNEILPTLDLPIYIFHGDADGYCDVNGVYEIKDTFKKLGKTNLSVNVFEKHGHGLEIDGNAIGISPGRKMLLDVVKNIK